MNNSNLKILAKIIVENQNANVPFLFSEFNKYSKIKYQDLLDLIPVLENLGILGPNNNSKREILINDLSILEKLLLKEVENEKVDSFDEFVENDSAIEYLEDQKKINEAEENILVQKSPEEGPTSSKKPIKKMVFIIFFSLLVLILLFLIPFSKDQPENDLSKLDLMGPVKFISTRQYNVLNKFGKTTKGSLSSDWYFLYNNDIVFNSNGFKTYSRTYNSSNEFYWLYAYEYNKVGDLTLKRFYNSNLKYKSKDVYEYDEDGNLKSQTDYEINDENNWDLDGQTQFTLNSLGVKIESKEYNSKGELIYINKYDENGYKQEFSHFENDKIDYKWIYTNDDEGNVLKSVKIDEEGEIVYKFLDKYESANCIESIKYNKDGDIEKKYTYKYDERNNKLEEILYEKESDLETKKLYKYEYDSYGNWIKQTRIENDIPIYIFERDILYFESDYENSIDLILDFSAKDSASYYVAQISDDYTENDLKLINIALDFDSNNLKAINLKARYYTRDDRFSLAKDYYNKVIDLYENSYYTYAEIGFCEFKLENYSSSINYFDKSIELSGNNYLPGWIYNFRGVSKYNLDIPYCDDFEKACDLEYKVACENFKYVCE